MPSGFQQNINQLSPNFYRVTITMQGGQATWPTADGNNNGAVNPYDWNSFSTLPSSTAKARQLARGNLRFQSIIEELCKHSDGMILDVVVTSSDNNDANAQPTSLSFTVKYERDEFILDSYQKFLLYEDSANTTFLGYGGIAITTTELAVRDMVVRGILRGGATGWSRSYRSYDPTVKEESQVLITIVRPDTPSDIWTDVDVTHIDGTELINIP